MMRKTARAKTAAQFALALRKYGFEGKELKPESLGYFGELVEGLLSEVLSFNATASSAERAEKVEVLMEVLERQQEQPTLHSLAKKLVLLFMLLRRLVQEALLDEPLQAALHAHVAALLKHDLPKLATARPKRPSSISKLYGYIRELSGSKERQPTAGRTSLEGESDRSALKEIITGIYEPFSCYLLRLLQSHESYLAALRRSPSVRLERAQQWGLVNSAKALGQIIFQMHRFARYFISDLLGILVYFTLAISKDLAVYYDALAGEAEAQAREWRLRVEEERVEGGQRRLHQLPEFQEARGLMEEVVSLRERIHYVFGNKHLKNYRYYFPKPSKYELRDDPSSHLFETLLDYTRRAAKSQHHSRSNLDLTDSLFLRHTDPLSTPEISAREAESQVFGSAEDELEYKLASAVGVKPRMNSWLGRAERNRHARVPPILTDKEDIVSTNE